MTIALRTAQAATLGTATGPHRRCLRYWRCPENCCAQPVATANGNDASHVSDGGGIRAERGEAVQPTLLLEDLLETHGAQAAHARQLRRVAVGAERQGGEIQKAGFDVPRDGVVGLRVERKEKTSIAPQVSQRRLLRIERFDNQVFGMGNALQQQWPGNHQAGGMEAVIAGDGTGLGAGQERGVAAREHTAATMLSHRHRGSSRLGP